MSDAAKWVAVYLINSVWQIPVLALCAAGLVKATPRGGARLHYRLWVGCLVLAVLLPAMPTPDHLPSRMRPGATQAREVKVGMLQEQSASEQLAVYIDQISVPARRNRTGEILLGLYALSLVAGMVVLLSKLCVTRGVVRRASRTVLPPSVGRSLMLLAESLGIAPVEVYSSAELSCPATVNWPRAMLLVPMGFSTIAERDAVAAIGHELAHVRRGDFAMNLGLEAMSLVAFYHPALHWIKRRIAEEREILCDEMAADITTGRASYAHSLLKLAEVRPLEPAAANLSLGVLQVSTLEMRIMRLIEERLPLSGRARLLFSAGCWVVFAGLAAGMMTLSVRPSAAQIADAAGKLPALEVVSVRPNNAPHGAGIHLNADGFTLRGEPLRRIINLAYDVRLGSLISGLPDWVNTERFDINGKVAESDVAAFGKLGPYKSFEMLQTILADRFQMKSHYETREMPVYELVIDKGGSKFKTGEFNVLPGGQHEVGTSSEPGEIRVMGVPFDRFPMILAGQLERPVIDKTGLTGNYVLDLKWTPDSLAMPDGGDTTPADVSGPSIFAALQEQLGLKLVAAKGPVKVLVIDHIERPSEN